jgi:hypothetical protein
MDMRKKHIDGTGPSLADTGLRSWQKWCYEMRSEAGQKSRPF